MYQTIFENKIKILIHGPNIETEDADCEFSCEFNDEKEPNSCTLKIYNLNEKNMNAVLENTSYVEVFTNQYGVKNEDGTLLWQNAFAGIPKTATKKAKSKSKKSIIHTPKNPITGGRDEADDFIEMKLQEGNGTDIGTFVSKSYRKGFNVKKILTDLAKSIDMEIVFDKNVSNFLLTYPIILHDNIRNSLVQVASYLGAKCTISNNIVYIVGENPTGVATYFQFDESNIQRPKFLQDKKIEFTATYMPSITVGSFIKLVNEKLNIDGIYQVCKVESKFSNHSEDCETHITVKY